MNGTLSLRHVEFHCLHHHLPLRQTDLFSLCLDACNRLHFTVLFLVSLEESVMSCQLSFIFLRPYIEKLSFPRKKVLLLPWWLLNVKPVDSVIPQMVDWLIDEEIKSQLKHLKGTPENPSTYIFVLVFLRSKLCTSLALKSWAMTFLLIGPF